MGFPATMLICAWLAGMLTSLFCAIAFSRK